ncbi:MAG: hypothetical protein V1766_05115 [Pseudomonadota bacterium]
MTKQEFTNKLQSGTILDYDHRWDKGRITFDLMPGQLIQFAEEDLSSKKPGYLVNALTNIKRALDCQIELIIFEHGYGKQLREKQWRFPRKIAFLQDNRIIAPRILEKINKTRNMLEHEFKSPTLEQVEDAFDVVLLFIGYTENLHRVPDSITIGFDPSTTIAFKVEFEKKNLIFKVYDDGKCTCTYQEGEEGFGRLLCLFHGTQPANWRLVHRSEIEQTRYQ